MEEKKQKKQKIDFKLADNQDNLSAGICGPDGCVIDWSKAKKNK